MNDKKIYNSIVKIITSNVVMDTFIPYNIKDQTKSIGAGFFIDNKGHILTAAHVVKNTVDIWINIPQFGKTIFRGEITCVYPNFDLALIKIKDKTPQSFLELGDSDNLHLGDKVYTLGYPKGSEYPMRTSGTLSGRRNDYIQADVPLNPGNSGGPVISVDDKVIGVSSAVLTDSENSSLIIPIERFKNVKDIMISSEHPIIYKNVIGVLFANMNDNYKNIYADSHNFNGGVIIKKILDKSPLQSIADEGDIMLSINDYDIDYYGEINVESEQGKVPVSYIASKAKPLGFVKIKFYSILSKKIKTIDKVELKPYNELYPIRQIFTHIEVIEFEVFAGIIVMNLNLDHILEKYSYLTYLITNEQIYKPFIIITHIFNNSEIAEFGNLSEGVIIKSVNNIQVKTVKEYREALREHINHNGKKYITIETLNNDKVVINLDDILKSEENRIEQYKYEPSSTYLHYKN